MANKFSEFLAAKKIDPRRLVAASENLEKFRPEDRALKLAKHQGKEEAKGQKPRSGRPVTLVLIDKASAGKEIPGAAKTRILRAVNSLLEQKKQGSAQLKELF
jgi:hypothetical protein